MSTAKTKTIGLVCSSELSPWISCRTIVPNLKTVYETIYRKHLSHYPFNESMTDEEYLRLALRIHRERPSNLVFIDHLPHPSELLTWIKRIYVNDPLPDLTFHIFGDFTYFSKRWLSTASLLKNFKVRFVCASQRQKKLLSRFLAKENSEILICPFPVNSKVFRSDQTSRSEWRKEMKIGAKEKVVCYTGRLSLQKNILNLVREFLAVSETVSFPTKLVLAGPFDDIGAPFFGIHCKPGYYFQQWRALIESLSSDQKKRICYLGELDSEELNRLYNGSDLYTSLSLHHDEDFGMAPAEALCSGTPTLLTDWGGYAAFSEAPDCSVVPVEISRSGLTFSQDEFRKLLKTALNSETSNSVRHARSERFIKKYSPAAVSQIVKSSDRLPHQPFRGFNWRMHKFAESNGQHQFPAGLSKDTFYEEIYGVYASARE